MRVFFPRIPPVTGTFASVTGAAGFAISMSGTYLEEFRAAPQRDETLLWVDVVRECTADAEQLLNQRRLEAQDSGWAPDAPGF